MIFPCMELFLVIFQVFQSLWEPCPLCVRLLFSDLVLGVLTSLATILLGKRKRAGCFVLWLSVVCLFLAVLWVGIQSEIVEFPGHTLYSKGL